MKINCSIQHGKLSVITISRELAVWRLRIARNEIRKYPDGKIVITTRRDTVKRTEKGYFLPAENCTISTPRFTF